MSQTTYQKCFIKGSQNPHVLWFVHQGFLSTGLIIYLRETN